MRWETMTGPELRALAGAGALPVLPVGSLEQHGPHLPVWTDSFIAHQIALRAADLAACQGACTAVVLPPIWLGLSEHHLPFGGTLSADYAAFNAVLRSVVRSLRALGFTRLLVVNGHGGNIEPLAVGVREAAHEFAMPVVSITWPQAAPAEIGQILDTQSQVMHACEAETSVWLALDPAQVRMELAPAPLNTPPTPAGYSRFYSFWEKAAPTGVRGDARAATAAKGEAILDVVCRRIADAMSEPALWTAPDPVWTPGRGLPDAR